MNELVELAGNVGFPIVVSIYLLVRVEGKLERLSESIYSLSAVIASLKEGA